MVKVNVNNMTDGQATKPEHKHAFLRQRWSKWMVNLVFYRVPISVTFLHVTQTLSVSSDSAS